jgi:hypothetical protein
MFRKENILLRRCKLKQNHKSLFSFSSIIARFHESTGEEEEETVAEESEHLESHSSLVL